MAILIEKTTKILIQGISGKVGRFHAEKCIEYGSQVVAGAVPLKGGEEILGIPIYDTVAEAKSTHCVDASLIFVPAPFAKEAILEAIESEISLIVCITEGIPVHDMIEIKNILKKSASRLIGPNCPGVITPDACKIGIMPGYIHKRGKIGIVSRSGTLTYEAVLQTTLLNLGQSTCVGIGGDAIIGTNFIDVLEMFEDDPETEGILLLGEIGGNEEEKSAVWIEKNCTKPIAAFIAGMSAPIGKRMGHAGAIISQGEGGAAAKIKALKEAGVHVTENPAFMGETMHKAMMS